MTLLGNAIFAGMHHLLRARRVVGILPLRREYGLFSWYHFPLLDFPTESYIGTYGCPDGNTILAGHSGTIRVRDTSAPTGVQTILLNSIKRQG